MRENIGLYRGKRIDNDEWVEGYYEPPVEFDGHKFGMTISYIGNHGWLDDAEIDPETVGECSGMPDKNGKKIFEGDIVRCIRTYCDGRKVLGHIIFENCCFCVKTGIDRSAMDLCDDFEVIGNIHDNPELLGGNSPC